MEVEEETPPRHPHSRRERGYFTASPRQDRMTYFARLLLSRGASSAPLISNRKSRGEPRRTAGQSARARAPLASAVSAGKKRIADQWDGIRWFRPMPASAAFAYAPAPLIRLAERPTTPADHPRSSIRGFVRSRVGSLRFFFFFFYPSSARNSVSRGMDSIGGYIRFVYARTRA